MVERLNFNHLYLFWVTAREKSLQQAALRLHLSQPTISAQIKTLEASLDEALFRPSGRSRVLTEAGRMVFDYAEEIFSLSGEMMNSLHRRPHARGSRFATGIAESFPKSVATALMRPLFAKTSTAVVTFEEGNTEELLQRLAAHHLDLVCSDQPAPAGSAIRAFNHPLGTCGVAICAAPDPARRLRRGFPGSLSDFPALLPTHRSPLRRSIEAWADQHGVSIDLRAEFDDLSLMKCVASSGAGWVPVPDVALRETREMHGFATVGKAAGCQAGYYAITVERKLTHPLIRLVMENARSRIFA
jgi:LysR family transcriptional regulator, transcriptional activator of nhaA